MTVKSCIVAITGASGSIYGLRLVEELLRNGQKVYLVISEQAFPIIRRETGIDWTRAGGPEAEKAIQDHFSSGDIRYFSHDDIGAPIASGTFLTDMMFVVPCSMKTLSGIANGYAYNLIDRAADVVLKEGRRLILAPREMPFNAIHLEHMLKLARLGVRVAAPVPAFYIRPKTVSDMVDYVVGKILDSAGLPHSLFKRWGQ